MDASPSEPSHVQRLKRRSEFVAAAKGGRTERSGFALQGRRREDDGPPRFGFTVTRKVGTAVERNRIRRRLKAAAAAAEGSAPGCDYVVVARRSAISQPFAELVGDLSGALSRLGRSPADRRSRQKPQPTSGASG